MFSSGGGEAASNALPVLTSRSKRPVLATIAHAPKPTCHTPRPALNQRPFLACSLAEAHNLRESAFTSSCLRSSLLEDARFRRDRRYCFGRKSLKRINLHNSQSTAQCLGFCPDGKETALAKPKKPPTSLGQRFMDRPASSTVIGWPRL
jgi:hypothetical protein